MKAVTALLLVVVLVAAAALSADANVKVTHGPIPWDYIREKLMPGVDDSTPHLFFKGLMQNIVKALPANVVNHGPAEAKADGSFGPWFAWIPLFMASSVPNSGESSEWSAPCFLNNTITSVLDADGKGATITITSTNPTSLLCSDWYLIGTLDGVVLKTADALAPGPSQVQYTFKSNISPAELDDIKRNGFRVFRFLDDFATTLVELFDTVMLFLPAMEGTGQIPPSCAAANLAFLDAYVDIQMENRTTTVVSIDEGLIQSGDLFGVIRLDGLDPMLAWAMGGSHTGHTTVAMRGTDGVLHVCESTTKDNYWPTNGIQCTPYATWITQAINADYNVVWLPLSQQSRGIFNNTAAWKYIGTDLNLNYGFGNLLWGWVDTLSDNYPYPLTWQLHELLPAWLGQLSGAVSDLLWNQAWNIRLGTTGLSTPDLYARMNSMGLSFGEMIAQPEMDSWLYAQADNNGTTVYGHSSVCDVFVCRVWKAAGLFGDTDFQCTEATNWDIYTLDIFEQSEVLPPQCTAADPTLPFCQLVGKHRLTLPYWNTRSVVTNSFNNCPRGSPPDWDKPVGC